MNTWPKATRWRRRLGTVRLRLPQTVTARLKAAKPCTDWLLWGLVGALVFLSACTVDSAKSRYLLAEKLWNDGKYSAAVAEFERVSLRDPHGKLGLQALYRAGMTQALYLNQYDDAVRKLSAFAESSGDTPQAWDVRKEIGEILYSRTEQYDLAIQHYQDLLQLRPNAPEAPQFLFRIARSYFYRWQFDQALDTYHSLIKTYPTSPLAERARYEIGETLFTRGEQKSARPAANSIYFKQAMKAFQDFVKRYPKSARIPEAKFGIASCLEELDQLDAAYQAYSEIESTYPSPKVIKIKKIRIRERQAQRSR